MNWVQGLFWLSVGVVVYSYVAYPLIVWMCARGREDAEDRFFAWGQTEITSGADWPMVTLVLAAYKEEKFIIPRLMNAVTQNYPSDRLEILVGCDGNEDLTGQLVETFDDPRVRLMQFAVRRGKASVLNDCVPAARGEIIVFSDANTMMEQNAIRRLVRHFDRPEVGAVCGKLHLTDPLTGQNVDGIYWKYENFIKKQEARLGALLGANGGIYAVRKELYEPIPPQTIIDDFVIGMRIHQQDRQILYDATAVAYEETPLTVGAEFHRRARIGAGGFQSLAWLTDLLHPRRGWLAFAFLSHKVLRWFCPAALLLALGTNVALARDPFYLRLLLAQELFYLMAAGAAWLSSTAGWQRPLRLPRMFVSMNLALIVGFFRWLRGIHSGTWKRTERETTPQDQEEFAGSH